MLCFFSVKRLSSLSLSCFWKFQKIFYPPCHIPHSCRDNPVFSIQAVSLSAHNIFWQYQIGLKRRKQERQSFHSPRHHQCAWRDQGGAFFLIRRLFSYSPKLNSFHFPPHRQIFPRYRLRRKRLNL